MGQAVTVSELAPGELARQLRRAGIWLRIGCYIVRLQSPIPGVAAGVALLYADYPVERGDCFADFHVCLTPPRNLRRWYRPQVLFLFDGRAPFKPLPLDQAFPMLEWGLNWCVHNHLNRHLIIHAAVVERDGFAVILPGAPGAGKSTLCAALVHRGWRLLSDELALISTADGMLTPMPRPVGLKNESIDVIRRFAPAAVIGRAALDTNKGTVAHMRAPRQSVVQFEGVARPSWIIFPHYEAGAVTRLAPRSKGHAFMRTVGNCFNYSRLGGAGFQLLADLVDACNCFEFTYSDLGEAVQCFAELDPPAAHG